MYDAVADEYCYAGTTILKNRLDLTNAEELDAFEAEVSDSRADEELPAGDLDFQHFKAIHRHLFQDVYDWAGEVRNVRISKDGNMFCYPENIAGEANKLFSPLRQYKFLKGSFVKRLRNQIGAISCVFECNPRLPGRQRAHPAFVFPAFGRTRRPSDRSRHVSTRAILERDDRELQRR